MANSINESPTQYAVQIGGSGANLFDDVSGLGTATQLLTSNGPGAAPTWQDAPASGGLSAELFSARKNGNQSVSSTSYQTVTFTTAVIIDQGSNFASSTYTAPATGNYLLCCDGYAADNTVNAVVALITSNRTYHEGIYTTYSKECKISNVADMDAADVANIKCKAQSSGSCFFGLTSNDSFFSGGQLN